MEPCLCKDREDEERWHFGKKRVRGKGIMGREESNITMCFDGSEDFIFETDFFDVWNVRMCEKEEIVSE